MLPAGKLKQEVLASMAKSVGGEDQRLTLEFIILTLAIASGLTNPKLNKIASRLKHLEKAGIASPTQILRNGKVSLLSFA
ncbi:MAG: hypothetical protein IJU40_05555 [Desulfovibrionaceae bacterium]|nr:hypothetical protein [Desulfovibrionaceae bacterium]